MKKILAVLLAATLVFACCGCGDNSSKKIKIGVLQFGEFDALTNAYNGFVDGLKEAGYVDGQNVEITMKSAAADTNNCPTIADTLINNNSDLILAIATPSALALKQKTTTIPVLFTAVTDPTAEESKLVESNEKPGGNLTGTSDMNPVAKQIDLLKQLVPTAKNVAVLYCSSEGNSKVQYELAKTELEKNGMTCTAKTISAVDEIKSAVESLKGKYDAVYVPTDNTIADAMTTVSATAISCKLPVICGEGGMVNDGGLATYGIDYYQLGKQTATMAVDVLKNDKKPADIPVETQNEKSLTVSVNKDTATALGITVPADILNKATVYPQ